MEEKYRILYQIGEVKFEIESTDKSWLEMKEKQYLDKFSNRREKFIGDEKTAPMETKLRSITDSITLNEFYQKYMKGDIKSRTVMAVFFVYYLQKIVKKEDIKSQDVADCFAQIGYPNYNKINMADVLMKSKRRALLNYVNKLWSLTVTGEDFVLNHISSEN
jgi:hypothetical protein